MSWVSKCLACGTKRADVRLNFDWDKKRPDVRRFPGDTVGPDQTAGSNPGHSPNRKGGRFVAKVLSLPSHEMLHLRGLRLGLRESSRLAMARRARLPMRRCRMPCRNCNMSNNDTAPRVPKGY